MDEVTVKTADLLKRIQANRDKHAQLYKDAIEGYKVATTKKLKAAMDRVEKGELLGSVHLSTPTDHTADYDEVIEMLKMSTDTKITLRARDFNNYVLDKWISQQEIGMLRTYALSSSNSANYIAK